MKRIRLNALVDLLAFPALLVSFFAGIIPWKVLPSGGGPGAGREAAHALFLGLTRGEWRDVHIYASIAFGSLMLAHFLLHWRWILCVPRLFAPTSARRHCPTEVLGPAVREPETEST